MEETYVNIYTYNKYNKILWQSFSLSPWIVMYGHNVRLCITEFGGCWIKIHATHYIYIGQLKWKNKGICCLFLFWLCDICGCGWGHTFFCKNVINFKARKILCASTSDSSHILAIRLILTHHGLLEPHSITNQVSIVSNNCLLPDAIKRLPDFFVNEISIDTLGLNSNA